MIKGLRNFFQNSMAPAEQADDDRRRLRVATCALLLEAAHADHDFSDAEATRIGQMVRDRFELSATEADELIDLADQQRQAAGDLYQFARLINDNFSRSRKLAVLELLWGIVYNDGVLEAHEDALMHRMGNMLGVRHEELMALKLKVKRSGEAS